MRTDAPARVLVTRPQPAAGRTAERLRVAGYQPVIVPLSEIEPLTPQVREGEFDAVAASSANAIRHAPAAWVAPLAAKPLFAVGNETAAAARKAGFADVRSSAGSAADLARDIAAGVGSGARVAYLCGRVRLDEVEASLAGAGIRIVAIETYDTRPRPPSPGELAALDSGPIAAVLVYSAKAAEALGGLAKSRRETIFSRTAFIAISERVAERLPVIASAGVFVSAAADEDGMFDLLLRMGPEPAPFPDNLN